MCSTLSKHIESFGSKTCLWIHLIDAPHLHVLSRRIDDRIGQSSRRKALFNRLRRIQLADVRLWNVKRKRSLWIKPHNVLLHLRKKDLVVELNDWVLLVSLHSYLSVDSLEHCAGSSCDLMLDVGVVNDDLVELDVLDSIRLLDLAYCIDCTQYQLIQMSVIQEIGLSGKGDFSYCPKLVFNLIIELQTFRQLSDLLCCLMKDSLEEQFMSFWVSLCFLLFLFIPLFHHRLLSRPRCRCGLVSNVLNYHVCILCLYLLFFKPLHLLELLHEQVINDSKYRRVWFPSQLHDYLDFNVSEMPFQWSWHLRVEHNERVYELPKLVCVDLKYIQHLREEKLLFIFNKEDCFSCTSVKRLVELFMVEGLVYPVLDYFRLVFL